MMGWGGLPTTSSGSLWRPSSEGLGGPSSSSGMLGRPLYVVAGAMGDLAGAWGDPAAGAWGCLLVASGSNKGRPSSSEGLGEPSSRRAW